MKNSSRTGAAGLANSHPAILAWPLALVVGAAFFVTGPHAHGAIVSAAGTGTIFTTGPGGPGPSVGPAPIPSAPADLSLFTGAGPVSAMLSENWIFTNTGLATADFDVNLDHHVASGPSPSGEAFIFQGTGLGGVITIEGDFSVVFTLDGVGLAPALIPVISYPVFWVGGFVTFDVAMHYADDFGPLGDRTLHFAPAPGSPGTFGTATGSGALALPPLIGGDHVVVSGSFKLTADAVGGPSTEIKVFGTTPEPGAAGLLALGGGMLLVRRKRR